MSKFKILFKAIKSLIYYNTHLMDYFFFHFIEKEESIQLHYANTLFMNKFHKKCNESSHRIYFQDKSLFLKKFNKYITQRYFIIDKKNINEFMEWLLDFYPSSIMTKKLRGTGGYGVQKINLKYIDGEIFNAKTNENFEQMFSQLVCSKYYLIEEYITQHDILNEWNPSCINTIRVITYKDKDSNTEIIGALIRLGVEGSVDNFHSGGIAVNIDIDSGNTNGLGFRMEPSDNEYFIFHPVTKVKLNGLKIPMWDEIKEMIMNASKEISQIRTVGWDVAVTPNRPVLIEGNDNWDKIILEKSLNKGIKDYLKKLENV